jgi:hypothetical protein
MRVRAPAGSVLLAALLLAACSGNADAPPGATSADEDRQLNEAAAMLDANSISLNAVTPDADIQAAPTTSNESLQR